MNSQLHLMAAQCRPLPLALAHWCVRERPGSERWAVVNRLYAGMLAAERVTFHAELLECRAARRGERLASIR